MIEKSLIITFLLSSIQSTNSLTEVNELSDESQAFQSNSNISDKNSLLIKRLKKQITSNEYNLEREAYEREVNDSIADYYAQRKAVMERYYARKKEISERFGKKPQETTLSSYINNTDDDFDKTSRINDDETSNYAVNDASEYEPGYHRIGRRTNSSDELLVYQHNIGIGLNGKSDLDAVFEVLLDEGIRMTFIELTPTNNSNAALTTISGGPGYNRVKLKLTPRANRGLSYTIKIWGYKTL